MRPIAHRTTLLTMVVVVSIGVTVIGQGALSGHVSLEARLGPGGPDLMDALDLEMAVIYSTGESYFAGDSLIVLPGAWVWQGFSGGATLGAFSLATNVLFSGHLAEHLYTEVIVGLPIGGIDFSFHAAQLGDAVLGGPHDGCAVRIAGSAGGLDLASITEFGARIEDDDAGFDGITIVHASTGRIRHYVTDPRTTGRGFSGEKLKVSGFSVCAADIEITTYFTCANGFEYVSFDIADIAIESLDWLAIGADLTFEVEEKALELIPTLDIGEVFCFTLFSELAFDEGAMGPLAVDGIKLTGLELAGEIRAVTLRDVVVLDPCEVALTTEDYGSLVMLIDDILDLGYEYYTNYWEMFSFAYAGPGCCEGESMVLLNLYFERSGAQLFDLAAVFVEANVPIGEMVTLTFGALTTLPDVDWIEFAFDVAF